jgi:phage terminase small subunit
VPNSAQRPLTPKQQRFVDEYLIDLNATAAYKRAGYRSAGNAAEVNASHLLRNHKVSQAVKVALDKRSADLGIDAAYVLSIIKETAERCRQVRPVLDRVGKPVLVVAKNGKKLVPEFAFDPTGVLKGAELLGKHLKMWTDKTELTGKDGGPLQVQAKVTAYIPDNGRAR